MMTTLQEPRGSTTIRLAALLALLAGMVLSAAAQNGVPSGKIVFSSDRTGSWQVYTMNPDGSDQFQVTNLPPTDDDGIFASISPNGQQIAFNYNGGDGPDIFLVNVDGTGLQQITNDHISLIPRWHPDGKRLVFTELQFDQGFVTGVITVMAADGKGKRNHLTASIWDSVGGIYTPDGKQIVFSSQMGGFVSAVWIMNSDGSNQRRLTRAALKAAPTSISPDGKRILMIDNLDSPTAIPNDLYVMNLDGSKLKELARYPKFHHDLSPSFSPDGTMIAFASDRFSSDITDLTYGTLDIFTMNADGTNIVDVALKVGSCPFDGNCVGPLWGTNSN